MAQSVLTAALPPAWQAPREADLPLTLSSKDTEHYRRIFASQAAGQWKAANRQIAALKDRVLLGSVEAQRLLDQRYHASYRELSRWLAHHASEPDAKAIYALALKRRAAGAPAPTRPIIATLVPRGLDDEMSPLAASDLFLKSWHVVQVHHRATIRRDDRELRANTMTHQARLLLASDKALRPRAEPQADLPPGMIANSPGGPSPLLIVQGAAIGRDDDEVDDDWEAGLAEWRMGRLREAGAHFEASTRLPGQSGSAIAASAFWAARVELRRRRPEQFTYWLGVAAEYPRTFYGLLARRTLGIDTHFDFHADLFTAGDSQQLLATPAGRRALALLQVGDSARAEAELRTLAPHAPPALIASLVALADRANMPALSVQLAGMLPEGNGRHYALYPVPRWTPRGGFTVDRALVFAMMRQESLFMPEVRSYAGAVGVMQLMPATAHAMAARAGVDLSASRKHTRATLVDPELNMALAQEYIQVLLQDENINGNLLLLAAAYNSGPGAVQRWESSPDLLKDPLLFLESIPVEETRIYTQRVLANYWIYRKRLNQPTPDLDALAAGAWPIYTALDTNPEEDRRHGENR